MGRILTIRRQVRGGSSQMVNLDNGNFNSNFRVVSVQAIPKATMGNTFTVLSTTSTAPAVADWLNITDNQQFAWLIWGYGGTSNGPTQNNVILDPDHIIVTDFWIHNLTGGVDMNYLITLEELGTSDSEAALYMLKERAQGSAELV